MTHRLILQYDISSCLQNMKNIHFSVPKITLMQRKKTEFCKLLGIALGLLRCLGYAFE